MISKSSNRPLLPSVDVEKCDNDDDKKSRPLQIGPKQALHLLGS